MKYCFWVTLLFFSLAAFAGDRSKDMASFQMVWETIQKKHWDLESTGADWDAVYKTYKPRVAKAKNTAETRAILTEMLSELGQSHFGILGGNQSSEIEELEDSLPSGTGSTGFEIVLVEERLFISKIERDSDAAGKGLGIGTEILAIRGEDTVSVVKRISKAYAESNHKQLNIQRALNSMTSGLVGSKVAFKVRKNGKSKKVKLELKPVKGYNLNLLNLSVFYHYESVILPENFGYVAFNVFVPDLRSAFENDMANLLSDTDGLIIDLRGNPGGLAPMAITVANRLVSEKGKKLGQMMNPGGTMNFPIFPQNPVYQNPVVVLIDGGSASTSEILAQGLKELERAKIIGEPSAGAALPSLVVELPNGDKFQYAIADYISFKGHHLEGSGVTPDILAPHTLKSLKNRKDAAMEAAKDWIRKTNAGAKNESF